MEEIKSVITTRAYQPDDSAFIFSSWLNGLRYGNDWFGLIDSDAYFSNYHKVIEALLDDPFTRVKVAVTIEDPNTIIGYSVYKGNKVHWVHVKRVFRGQGVAKTLLPSKIDAVTHVTKAGRSWLKKHTETVFNPFNIP